MLDALPSAVAFWFVLGAHEWGHWQAAKKYDLSQYLPFVLPGGLGPLGSFGAITRLRGFAPNRTALLEIARDGPAVGMAVSLVMLLLGFGLTAAGVTDIEVDSPAFGTSVLVSVLGQLTLGEKLAEPSVAVNFLLVAGWAGMFVNSLNSIPAGELDGGRMALALWGRRPAALISLLSIVFMGFNSFDNPLSFWWVLVVLILQRGPILPAQDELSPANDEGKHWISVALLASPFLVLAPFPTELVMAIQQMQDPVPF